MDLFLALAPYLLLLLCPITSRWRETRIDREFGAHSLAMPIARHSV
jgi:hypothetical protein